MAKIIDDLVTRVIGAWRALRGHCPACNHEMEWVDQAGDYWCEKCERRW